MTSWGDGCAVEGTFGVYARVEFYMEWIASQFGYGGTGLLIKEWKVSFHVLQVLDDGFAYLL